MILVERDSAEAADILTPVSQASAAGVSDFVAADGTFVAGNVNYLDHVGILLVPAHSNLDALGKYRTLLINTAAHGRGVSGDYYFGNVQKIVK